MSGDTGMHFAVIRRPRSLAGQALLLSVGTLLLVITLVCSVFSVVLFREQGPYPWEGLRSDVSEIEQAMHFDAQGHLISVDIPSAMALEYDGLQKDLAFQILNEQRMEFFSSNEGEALKLLRGVATHPVEQTITLDAPPVVLRVWAHRIQRGENTYYIRVARSVRLASILRTQISTVILISILATVILSVIVFASVAFWTTRRIARPLRDASAAALAIRPENMTQRLDSHDMPSEIMPLIRAFNGALERLENGYRIQKEFVASAAHELKTPLALIRAEIEMEEVPDRALLLHDVDIMARQIHQLLQLAEASEAQNYIFESLDVWEALSEAVVYARRQADSNAVRLSLLRINKEPIIVSADRGAFSTLARNLIENAILHSPAGGVVTIHLGRQVFFVRDCGPGVAPDEVGRLFTRFWRSKQTRHEGAGLGLSICREITRAHHWKIDYQEPDTGNGAIFSVSF